MIDELEALSLVKKSLKVENTEYSFPKASPQLRLAGFALDLVLRWVTMGIGWMIWSLIIWGQGQTPGK